MWAAKRILLPVARGTEEIEFAAIMGVMRRAEVEVVVAKVTEKGEEPSMATKLSRGMVMEAETSLEEVQGEEFDAIVCPGGAIGSTILGKDNTLVDLLKEQRKN